ncbi:hypothetical protein JVX90_15920 [Gordonia sp. PDNC005]|uniref:thiamine pyrophosphate-binding protein n=1 Tax=unclassified Gordonia (in: high G+C Gram-positive bacteria) TaxID=2657482 RepID=UPI0019655A31|nr:thiamine pyrophosphate-binding protein [Gordonia sp. PDNC005]QRY61876.1 hypothetical protein JVX90_15920 [Gordonia sp. PDNC005]
MTDTTIVDGGTAAALALEALGVTKVFTVPSAHNLTILKALHTRGSIQVIGCRHEQGVVHAADGHARVSGELSVGIVSTGPGTANTMGGLYEAHYASSPVLLITTQIPTTEMGRGRGFVHEADDQAEMLRTVCKRVVTVDRPEAVANTIVELGLEATHGRPRPVAVEIPIDVQDMPTAVDTSLLFDAVRPAGRLVPAAADLEAAVAILTSASRPVIWAGGGVLRSGAEKSLLDFARAWNAPVLTTREGRGALPDDDSHSLGALGTTTPLPDYLATCDVMLAVGTRFQQFPTAEWSLPFPDSLVHLDVDPDVMNRSYRAAATMVADADEGLRALVDTLPSPDTTTAKVRAEHLAAGQAAAASARDLVVRRIGADHAAICASINSRRARGGPVVRDATVPAYAWGETLMSVWEPRTSVRSTAAGIGPGLPLAIGAALAANEHTILLQGDGGFMLSVGELATAAQANAPVVICLFNDSGYQMLRNIEGGIGDGDLHDVDLVAPDFTDLARSFGIRAEKASSAAEFDRALAGALAYRAPTLIEIDMGALTPLTFPFGSD